MVHGCLSYVTWLLQYRRKSSGSIPLHLRAISQARTIATITVGGEGGGMLRDRITTCRLEVYDELLVKICRECGALRNP